MLIFFLSAHIDSLWILGNFGFGESQRGAAAPEESRRKVEQCRPASKKRAPTGQKQQDGGDTLKSVRQSANSGIAELGSDGLGWRGAFFPQREENVGEGDAASGSRTFGFDSLDFTAEQGNLARERRRIVRFVRPILEQFLETLLFVLRVHQARFEFAGCWVISSAASSSCSTRPTTFNSESAERYSEEGTRNVADRTLPDGWPTMRSFAT